jgi:hypothetical protein
MTRSTGRRLLMIASLAMLLGLGAGVIAQLLTRLIGFSPAAPPLIASRR